MDKSKKILILKLSFLLTYVFSVYLFRIFYINNGQTLF